MAQFFLIQKFLKILFVKICTNNKTTNEDRTNADNSSTLAGGQLLLPVGPSLQNFVACQILVELATATPNLEYIKVQSWAVNLPHP